MTSRSDDIDWGPAEEAARWVGDGRLREALAILPVLGRTGAIVEDAVIEGDATVVAQALGLLDDDDARIAAWAAHLLGERAVRRGSTAEMERPLLDALGRALASDPDRVRALAAALRECARTGGARDAAPELLEIVRRHARGAPGELELMWAVEALIELGWSAERIVEDAGALAPGRAKDLRDRVEDIERGLRMLERPPGAGR